jgi:hypothetical protein
MCNETISKIIKLIGPHDNIIFSQMSLNTGNRRLLDFNFQFVDNLPLDTFENYNKNLYRYKYILSPHGDSEDCYRHWEAISCGCIPITIRHPKLDSFKDAPILFLNDWSELTEELLNEKYEELIHKNWEMSTVEYWKNFILDK